VREMSRYLGWRVAATLAAVGASAAIAPSASAVIGRTASGRLESFALVRGVSPASIPGSAAAQHRLSGLASNGSVDYHGGPVVHSMAPYVVFWTPGGFTISATTEALIERYFTDVAAESGTSINVYGVLRQYTDSTGFADYSQTFSSASQAIVDTDAYPTTSDSSGCPNTLIPHTDPCITDAQLTAEISSLIAAQGLPTDGSASSTLPSNAPEYYLVLPPNVNECVDSSHCSDNSYCAYHGAYADGSDHVLYAVIPTVRAALQPKSCQDDGNSAVQEPNGDQVGDVTINNISQAQSGSISNPFLDAWSNSNTGSEIEDECNSVGSYDPNGNPPTNPNAFTPAMGGSAGAGTLYNQLNNGNRYYTQSEWSNGDLNCKLQPTAQTLSTSFSVIPLPGNAVGFDPSRSRSSAGYSSTTWSFGDGQASFNASSPSIVEHTYGAAGTYFVTLMFVDSDGNVSLATQQITVGASPRVSFSSSPRHPVQGMPVSFSGTTSDANTGVVFLVGFLFGDRSAALGTSTTHVFTHPGTYTVTMAFVDTGSHYAFAAHTVTVAKAAVTKVAVKHKTTEGAKVLVTVNARGSVSAAGKSKTTNRAGTVTLKIKLTNKQRQKLARDHKLTLKFKVTFKPKVGSSVTQTVTVTFKA
jgi:hypothetical protein